MTYEVPFRPAAERDLLALPREMRLRVLARIEALAADPRPPASEPLAGDQRGRRRLRVGACRAVYSVEDRARLVQVIAVGSRRGVYKDTSRCD